MKPITIKPIKYFDFNQESSGVGNVLTNEVVGSNLPQQFFGTHPGILNNNRRKNV